MDNLDDRLKKIEERLNKLEDILINNRSSLSNAKEIHAEQLNTSQVQAASKQKDSKFFHNWFLENWIVGVGILFVMLAGGWFVSYAFANEWIGPAGRVLFCFIVGIAVYIGGFFLLEKNQKGGQALMIIGQTIAILAVVAGHQLYNLVTPITAFAIMASITACTAGIAVIKHLDWLGFASIATAMIIPSLVHMKPVNKLFLFNYVLLIDVAALCMLLLRGWGWTFHVAWFGTLCYILGYYEYKNKNYAYFYIAVFYLLFAVPAAINALKIRMMNLPWNGVLLLFTSMLSFIVWLESLDRSALSVIYYIASALFNFVVSWKLSKDKEASPKNNLFLGAVLAFNVMISIFMATNQTTSLLNFDLKEIPYLIEIVAAILVAQFFLKTPIAAQGLALFYLVPLISLMGRFEFFLNAPILSLDFATYFIAFVVFVITAMTTRVSSENTEIDKERFSIIPTMAFILAGVFLMGMVWNICHNLISNENIAHGVALIIYTIAGEVLIFLGNFKEVKYLRYGGIGIIVYVIAQLLYVEVWEMPPVIRTITFVITGILLIATAFFDKKFKNENP